MRNFYPSKHAVGAMIDRGVSWEEVLAVLAEPETQYINTRAGKVGPTKATVSQRGKLYVVTAISPEYTWKDEEHLVPMYAVITVGLRQVETWNNDNARARNQH